MLDLEDAVAASAKDAAREQVVATLSTPELAGRTVAVRINPPGTPWCHLDLAAIATLPEPPRSVIVPKVESAADLAFVERLLDGIEPGSRHRALRVQALIETARGLERVREIASCTGRLEALILGYADLAASLGRARTIAASPHTWMSAQDALLISARSNGLQAIDGPYLGTEPDEPFLAASRHASDLGFDGKWAIHPSQIGTLNLAFTAAPGEVKRARDMLAALEQAQREQKGAVAFQGEMLDEALAANARRILARAGRES